MPSGPGVLAMPGRPGVPGREARGEKAVGDTHPAGAAAVGDGIDDLCR
jgi:hypothetical protein